MARPKELRVQFDENDRVTHVITGGPAPESFARYVLVEDKPLAAKAKIKFHIAEEES